jgi:hypothetical protein
MLNEIVLEHLQVISDSLDLINDLLQVYISRMISFQMKTACLF